MLLNVSGSQWDPVSDITVTGLVFTATAYTYMMPHAVPSAGDWALERHAAVFLEGTEGVVLDSCEFVRLDGNALMVSGFNCNATVTNSDFAYIGGTAVAAWGYTNDTAGYRGFGDGANGTDGNHPRSTTVRGNVVREVGLYEKQSSFFMQAKAAQSVVEGNASERREHSRSTRRHRRAVTRVVLRCNRSPSKDSRLRSCITQ